MADEIKPGQAGLEPDQEALGGIVQLLGERKMLGMTVPEEYGGTGRDAVAYALSLMAVSKASASAGAIMAANHALCCYPLQTCGSHEQKRVYLQPCASGKSSGCFALAEDDAGREPIQIRTLAVREGDGWIIRGQKRFIASGPAPFFCIFTAYAGEGKSGQGVSAFVIPLDESEGLRLNLAGEKGDVLALWSGTLAFDQVRAPGEALLGTPGQGLEQWAGVQRESWLGIASLAMGIGRASQEETQEWVKKTQGYTAPAFSRQAVQWKLADMAMELDAAELLTMRAAWLKDYGKPYEKEVAMARISASEAALRAAAEGIQIMGGYGFDPSMEKHLRNAKRCQISMGGHEAASLAVARNLTR